MNPKAKCMMLDDKDIYINIGGEGSFFHLSFYNDKTNKAVASFISRQKLKELATFFNEYLEKN